MKICSVFLYVLLFLPFLINAQSAERTLIGSSGGDYVDATFSADYSIGEAIVHTLSTASVTLLQGFQQPSSAGVYISNLDLESEISIFPNPGSGALTLNLGQTSTNEVSMDVYNMLGEHVWNKKFDTRRNLPYQFNIDLSHMASGAYLIRISDGKKTTSIPYVIVFK